MADVLKFPTPSQHWSDETEPPRPVVREYETVGELFGGLAREIEEDRAQVALTWARDCAEAYAHVPLPEDNDDST